MKLKVKKILVPTDFSDLSLSTVKYAAALARYTEAEIIHGGKISVARVLAGEFGEGSVVQGAKAEERAAAAFSMLGADARKRPPAKGGETVALGRLEKILSGETISTDKGGITQVPAPEPSQPVYGTAINVKDRKDEVKLTGALARLVEEDPSLKLEHAKDTHQMVLWGQGEMHLRVSLERLKRKYGVDAESKARQLPYKETIRKAAENIRGRHKKQSGGHGQFGDIVIDIKPLPRGSGFQFSETITGGVVPRQYIPSVEIGVQEFLKKGPLGGFPVVDVAVILTDGSYHAVDSSDMAFRQAGRIGMQEGMPMCNPVLLEPILEVEIAIPSDATARVNGMIPQRRGQILGFDSREGWPGWDVVRAHIPESEMADLIVELRSATAGVGTFTSKFHHLAELTGRLADNILAAHKQAAE
jgi:elongation factor G